MSTLVRLRWLALLALLLTIISVSRGVEPATTPDNSMRVWFLDDDPALQRYEEFHDRFGNDEVAFVHVEFPEGAYSAEALTTLRTLAAQLEAVDGVARVHTLADVPAAEWSEAGLRVRPAFPESLADEDALAKSAEALRDNPLVVDYLVDASGEQAMVWIEMEVADDFDARRDAIVGELRSTADDVLGARAHHLAGTGVLYAGLNEVTEADFGLFLGLGVLVMFVALGFAFRSAMFSVAALLVLALATVFMFGVYGLAGHQLNMVTSVLPIIILALGVADIVHFPAAYVRLRRAQPEADRRALAVEALREVWWPCVLTTVTSIAGFLALTSAPIAVVRELGTYAALGLAAALLASAVLMAIAFVHAPEPRTRVEPKRAPLSRLLAASQRFVERAPKLALASLAALIVTAGIGASRVEIDTYTLGYLPEDHAVTVDHAQIEAEWGDYAVLEFIVRPHASRSIDDPDVLAAMDEFVARAVETEPAIRQGLALGSVYRALSPTPGEPLADGQVDELHAAGLVETLEWDPAQPAYADNVLAAFRTEDGELARIKLVGSMLSAAELEALLGRLESIAASSMGERGSIEPSGYLPLYVRIIDYVMQAQVTSFFLALALIFAVMWIGLRSLRLALISLVPNLFPVLVMFGVMGFAGIDLDVATASIAAIVIGVSIDDTVHFLWAWRAAERRGMAWSEALTYTLERAGRAAVITTALLVAGYGVLMAGSGATVFYFGLLTTVAAVTALVGDLVLLPLLLRPLTRPEAS